jgi:hypothetical protein
VASNMRIAGSCEAVRPEREEEIPAEILAVIVAAATAFLGADIRILSAQMQHSPNESVSRWTRQGRASVQASHNLRTRR